MLRFLACLSLGLICGCASTSPSELDPASEAARAGLWVDGADWSVRQGEQSIIVHGRWGTAAFPVAPPDGKGWMVEEANAMRVRLRCSATGATCSIYADGREYADGQYTSLFNGPDEADLADQHQHPASIELPDDQGRIVRDTAGDAANDGYNECNGAYQIAANGGRLELRIIPATPRPRLVRPVLEISDLPDGPVVVNVEGKLAERVVRDRGGHVLVELPGTLDHPTVVSVNVHQAVR